MAKQMKQKVKGKKGGKKGFFEVEAPMTAVKVSLYGGSAEEFEGRVVTIDMTKSLRGKSLELRMKVKNVDGKLIAELISAKLAGSFIRRSMRRGTDYVEDSILINCKDGKVAVKPFMITRRRVSRAVRRALREEARKFLEGYVRIRTVKDLFSEIMASKIQRSLASKLKKIYPLAFCEIRTFEVLGEKEKVSEENEVVEEVNEVEEANASLKEEKEIKEVKKEVKVKKVKVEKGVKEKVEKKEEKNDEVKEKKEEKKK
jgi:ribosomal protein S3AE